MAKYKGIKWAQVLTAMAAIANTLVNNYATKAELQEATGNLNYSIQGSTLILPSKVSISGSTLVLPN
ncbi:MAG: hypothetical protein IJG07_05660 [Prevotella sp.]|nr:hypothetical protein [Prevotella sp.]